MATGHPEAAAAVGAAGVAGAAATVIKSAAESKVAGVAVMLAPPPLKLAVAVGTAVAKHSESAVIAAQTVANAGKKVKDVVKETVEKTKEAVKKAK